MASGVVHVLILIFVIITQTHAAFWDETIPYEMGEEKMTKLHLYIHEIVTGANPTAIRVIPPIKNGTSTLFGMLAMMDDPLTEGPDLNSRLVGRGQGFYGFAGQNERALIMAVSLIFTDEKFNGSTLSVLTPNPTTQRIRQFSIVGGTGVFQFARGIVDAKTYWNNSTTGDAIIEYNLTVIHY